MDIGDKNFLLGVRRILVLSILLSLTLVITTAGMEGSGTSADPYVITNVDELQAMNNDLDAYYVLGNNIDASETSTWNAGAGFDPIGSSTSPNEFKGSFNGQGHVIMNLYIDRPSKDSVGLFGYTDSESGYIKNVGLENVDITGGYRTGGLVGRSSSTISNCYVTGQVSGASNNSVVGGLIGQSHEDITNCYSRADIESNYAAGGLVEWNNGNITNCYSTGSVTNVDLTGGLVAEPGGYGNGQVGNSFWDTDTSGQPDNSANHIVISEVYYNADDEYDSEFIEFYNPTNSPVNIADWDFTDDGGSSWVNFGTETETQNNTVIPSYGFLILADGEWSSQKDDSSWPSADIIDEISLNNDGDTVKIRDGSDTVVDSVTYIGNAVNKQGVERKAVSASTASTMRNGDSDLGNSYDTDMFSDDFVDPFPGQPQNTSSAPENLGMTGKTTAEMKEVATFTDTVTEGLDSPWDFVNDPNDDMGTEDIWDIDAFMNDGYPFLTGFDLSGPAAYLKVTGSGTTTAGEANELTITAYDEYDMVATSYTGDKSLTFTGPGVAPDGTQATAEGETMSSATTVHFTDGVSDSGAATLIAYKAEATTVDVSDGTIDSSGDSSYDLDLTVNPAATDNLNFSQQPTDSQADQIIDSPVEVQVRDQYNNICANDDTTEVDIAIDNNPGSGTLSGTTTQAVANGIATFNDLSIDKTGEGYTLKATSGGLTPDISDAFSITAGPSLTKGDVDGDGDIDMDDAKLVARYALGLEALTSDQKQAADVARPFDVIDIRDAVAIAEVAQRLSSGF